MKAIAALGLLFLPATLVTVSCALTAQSQPLANR